MFPCFNTCIILVSELQMTSVQFKTLGALEQRGKSKCVDVLTSERIVRQLYTDVVDHYTTLQPEQYFKETKANVSCTKEGQKVIRPTTQTEVRSFHSFKAMGFVGLVLWQKVLEKDIMYARNYL